MGKTVLVRNGRGGDAHCPYCRTTIAPLELVWRCPGCRTAHHHACMNDNGGRCTLLGCKGTARGRPPPSPMPGTTATAPRNDEVEREARRRLAAEADALAVRALGVVAVAAAVGCGWLAFTLVAKPGLVLLAAIASVAHGVTGLHDLFVADESWTWLMWKGFFAQRERAWWEWD